MAFNKQLITIISVLFSLTACSGGGSDDPNSTPQPPLAEKRPIHISPTLQSRATESNFEIGDYIGLYIVNHPSDGSVAKLQTSGNHVDNMKFTYNGTWTPASPTYWKDDKTHADFYLYYPYATAIGDVNAIPWSVNADQSTSEKYKAGDLLIGKTTDVTPTEGDVGIAARQKHKFTVTLSKTSNGVNVNITKWEDDGIDYGGTAE